MINNNKRFKIFLRLSKLKNNEQEATTIAKLFDGEIWTRENGNETQFMEQASSFDIIHLSTHGIMNNQQPAFSYIAFSEQRDSIENELLYVSEIQNMQLNAQLIVLSACQSASGPLYRGEGLISIARSFRMAGAQSLVASLWNVDDKQTPNIMASFYEALKAGKSKTIAMQEAKKAYISQASHIEAHPFYWSGFLNFGNPKPLSKKLDWSNPYFTIASICLLLILFFARRMYYKSQKNYSHA